MLDKVKAANAVNYSPVMPVIDKTIRLLVRDGAMEVQATALDQWYVARIMCSWPDMDVVVDGSQLMSACTLLGDDLSGTVAGPTLILKNAKGRTTLQLVDGEFPDLKRPAEMAADIMSITDMSWCCGNDDLRPALSGIYYGDDAVATDLSMMVVRHGTGGPGVVIPPHVMKWQGKLSVAKDKRSAYVIGEDWFYGSLLIDAPFPPYNNLLGNRAETTLTLPRAILSALTNKTVVAAGYVRISDGMLRAMSPTNDVDIELAADIKTAHPIWFNPKKLAEIIDWIGLEEITFTLDEGNPSMRAMMWRDGKRTALIMPIAPLL